MADACVCYNQLPHLVRSSPQPQVSSARQRGGTAPTSEPRRPQPARGQSNANLPAVPEAARAPPTTRMPKAADLQAHAHLRWRERREGRGSRCRSCSSVGRKVAVLGRLAPVALAPQPPPRAHGHAERRGLVAAARSSTAAGPCW
ncbi:unnamed protein product [Urochloa humidicola]